jgi:MFS family permease
MPEESAQTFSIRAYGRLLRSNRDFRLLWLSQVVSEIGDWLYAVTVYSLLLDLTGKAESVGFAVVLQLLPQVFIAPAAGVLNDRLPRRAVMIFADVARIFIVLAMLLVDSPSMVWLVYLILIAETVMWALFEPGRSAIIPTLAPDPKEQLVANALSSITWSVNLAFGAGLGGAIALHFGRDAIFMINAATFVVSALLLMGIRTRERHAEHLPPFQPRELVDFKPILEGIDYVRRDSRRLATMLVKAGMGLMGAHWVILPIYGDRVFRVSDSATAGMSVLFMARGIGSIIGSFSTGVWARNDERLMRKGIFWAFLIAGASYVILSGAPSLPVAALAVMAGHVGSSQAWVFSTTMLQRTTEDRFRGRVFSADFAGLFLMMAGVSYAASHLIDGGVDVRSIALATGLISLIPALLWWWAQRLWSDG